MEDIVENFLIEKLNDIITNAKAQHNENKVSNCKLFLVHEECNKLKELIEESTANTGAALKHTRREKLYYLLNVMAEWLQLLQLLKRQQFVTPVAVAWADELRGKLKQIEKDLKEPLESQEVLRARLQKIENDLQGPLEGEGLKELRGRLKQIQKDLTEPVKGESQGEGGSQQPPKEVTAEDLRARLQKIKKHLKVKEPLSQEDLLGRLKKIKKDLTEPLKGESQRGGGSQQPPKVTARLKKIEKDVTEPFKGERQDQIYRWSSHAVDIAKIHGFKDKDMIMKRLLLKEGHKVITVVGVAGVGKTALCQVAFNKEEVQKHFPFRIWLCLSRQQNFHAGNQAEEFLVKRALSCLGFDDDVIERIGQGGVHKLKAALQQQLRGEYLIVLDDVWKIEKGDKLEEGDDEMGKAILNLFSFFIQDGGTVLVTSRSGKLEETVVRPPNKLHRLQLLPLADDDSCWRIFSDAVNRAGFQGLDRLKKEILINCQGLPLMAKMLGQICHLQLETQDTEVKNKTSEIQTQQETG